MSRDQHIGQLDFGLQHERTVLAWERTAIAMMVAGVILARYAASDAYVMIAFFGLLQTACGGALLVWAGRHYDELHGPVLEHTSVVHPAASRLVGLTTLGFTALAFVLAIMSTLLS